jgi:hypothetical protein
MARVGNADEDVNVRGFTVFYFLLPWLVHLLCRITGKWM